MIITRICAMIESCTTDSPLFPPTLLYNEGWLLRLVIDWFSMNDVPNHPLSFPRNARWYSEALLPSAFLARRRADRLAESWTHVDAAIGHFEIGKDAKADLSLLPDAEHFVVLEAKMFSRLSSGVKNAKYFDQAARTVACVAKVLKRADRHPSNLSHLGFYVLAPQSQIDAGRFDREMERDSMRQKVEQRVAEYAGAKDQWYVDWFEPTLQRIEIGVVSWEDLIGTIAEHDSASAHSIEEFYEQCVRYNQSASKAFA
jgi:hypothetical protein